MASCSSLVNVHGHISMLALSPIARALSSFNPLHPLRRGSSWAQHVLCVQEARSFTWSSSPPTFRTGNNGWPHWTILYQCNYIRATLLPQLPPMDPKYPYIPEISPTPSPASPFPTRSLQRSVTPGVLASQLLRCLLVHDLDGGIGAWMLTPKLSANSSNFTTTTRMFNPSVAYPWGEQHHHGSPRLRHL